MPLTNVTAVLKCTRKTDPVAPSETVSVTLDAYYQDAAGNRINTDYARYTPSAQLTMSIDNPSAAAFYEVGKFYKLTFEEHTPVPTTAPAE